MTEHSQFERLRDFFGDLVDALEEGGGDNPNLTPLEKEYCEILNTTRDKAAFFIKQLILFRKMERAKQAYFDGMGDAKLWHDRLHSKAPRVDA